MPQEIGKKLVLEKFGVMGPLTQIHIPQVVHNNDQSHQGFGFINYHYPELANLAVDELHGKTIFGSCIKV